MSADEGNADRGRGDLPSRGVFRRVLYSCPEAAIIANPTGGTIPDTSRTRCAEGRFLPHFGSTIERSVHHQAGSDG
jgi:hypothetical protein